MRNFLLIGALLFLLTACGTSNNEKPSSGSNEPLPPADIQVKEGDFVYRLFTEKDVYEEFGDTAIFAELTYVGDLDSVDIYHSASPFEFPFEERTRGIEVGYAMNEPLIITTLKKDEPLRQNYSFAGGYSDQDEKNYVDFVKTIIEKKGFPVGEYILHGSANFYTADPGDASSEQRFLLEAAIGFHVVKNINE